LGEKSNAGDFLANCDVFVFPSEFEGLGIELAEAMAVGCACVASDIRPLDEYVVSRKNGLLVPAADADALADAINEVLGDPGMRNKLGSEAKCTARELFEPRKAAQRLVEIYRSCCAQ
jgi:glycosyltransferase involved in cell wall biosynthesis